MKQLTVVFVFLALIAAGCTLPKANNNSLDKNSRMEFTVTKIQNEKDGQTLFMEDNNGGKFITIISPANGNFVELKVGDKISLVAEEIMESDPAQIISKDIKVLGGESSHVPIEVKISTDKETYNLNAPITLSFEVKNRSDKPYTFLPWQTPLEKRLTSNCMHVTFKGTPISYSGIMVKRMPPTQKDSLTILAGESSSEQINLLEGYKLMQKGVYKVQFKDNHKDLPASNEIELTIK